MPFWNRCVTGKPHKVPNQHTSPHITLATSSTRPSHPGTFPATNNAMSSPTTSSRRPPGSTGGVLRSSFASKLALVRLPRPPRWPQCALCRAMNPATPARCACAAEHAFRRACMTTGQPGHPTVWCAENPLWPTHRPLRDTTNTPRPNKRPHAATSASPKTPTLKTRGVRTRNAVGGALAAAAVLPGVLLAATLSSGSPPEHTQFATPPQGSAVGASPRAGAPPKGGASRAPKADSRKPGRRWRSSGGSKLMKKTPRPPRPRPLPPAPKKWGRLSGS